MKDTTMWNWFWNAAYIAGSLGTLVDAIVPVDTHHTTFAYAALAILLVLGIAKLIAAIRAH
jgi:hypothetical protein